MKIALRALFCVLLVLVLAGWAAWTWNKPKPSPPFGVLPRRITPTTEPSLAVGQNFAAFVAPDGSLWAWGDARGGGGNLGLSTGWIPQKLSDERDWKQVTAGFFGLLALKQDGALWALGSNGEGLLGLPSSVPLVKKLTEVKIGSDWKEIRAGVSHCLALKTDGSLWAWGQNNYGQIGNGFVNRIEPPTRIDQETNWIAISPSDFSSYALRSDGTIWAWGLDFVTSKNTPTPYQLGAASNWTTIAAGAYHLAAISADGFSWMIGANGATISKEAPSPTTNWFRLNATNDWTQIRSGENCILALRNGTWYPAGMLQSYGAEGPWFPQSIDPLALHTARGTTLILMRDGRLWSLGKRIGADTSRDIVAYLKATLLGLLGKNSNLGRADLNDSHPVLIWEQ